MCDLNFFSVAQRLWRRWNIEDHKGCQTVCLGTKMYHSMAEYGEGFCDFSYVITGPVVRKMDLFLFCILFNMVNERLCN